MNDTVSIIIPARNERYLQATIDGLLENAAGEIEIIPVIEGKTEHLTGPSKPDARVRQVVHAEPKGMRPAINAGAGAARGRYLMKCDAHCIFAPGYDMELKQCCGLGDLVVPTRHSIHAESWTPKLRFFNYSYLTFPWTPTMYGIGLHAKTFDWDLNKQINAERAHLRIDEIMSFQGSCWLMHRDTFMRRLHPLDHENYYFYQEAQEVGFKIWLSGGRCLVNKNTWYGHLHKASTTGRGFYLSLHRKRKSEAYAADYWLNDRWPPATRTFAWLVDHFWDSALLARHGWPDDWQDPRHENAFYNRPEVPAHI
jgi:glycosyltransferase involved in cell wall biosynthesis